MASSGLARFLYKYAFVSEYSSFLLKLMLIITNAVFIAASRLLSVLTFVFSLILISNPKYAICFSLSSFTSQKRTSVLQSFTEWDALLNTECCCYLMILFVDVDSYNLSISVVVKE